MPDTDKRSIPIAAVVSKLLDDMVTVRATIDDIIHAELIHSEAYTSEREGLLYVLSLLSLLKTTLSAADKDRLTTELTIAWCRLLRVGDDLITPFHFLQERMAMYHRAIRESDRSLADSCAMQLLRQLGIDPSQRTVFMELFPAYLHDVICLESDSLNDIVRAANIV